jgi:WXXGXW repeat (2 copies)
MKTKIITLLSRSASVRTLRRLTSVSACCGALGLLAGCASQPESHMVSSPPPPSPTRSVTTTTTTTTPDTMPAMVSGNPANVIVTTASPAAGTTIVTEAPPALQSDVMLAQPSPSYVWIAGYWTWRSERYEWVAGHWEMPPNPGSVWVAPRSEQQGNAYRFTEGYWN